MEQWQRKDNPDAVVEAIRLNEDAVEMVAAWCRAEVVEEIDPEHPEETQYGLNVPTLNGPKRASLGMYVVKYANQFFVSHNRPFEMMYKPVNRPAPPPESAGDARKARGWADPFGGGRSW